MNDPEDNPIIGFVTEIRGRQVTACPGCTIKEQAAKDSPIRDGPHYGDTVPYPECFGCGEVLNPDAREFKTRYRCVCGKEYDRIQQIRSHAGGCGERGNAHWTVVER